MAMAAAVVRSGKNRSRSHVSTDPLPLQPFHQTCPASDQRPSGFGGHWGGGSHWTRWESDGDGPLSPKNSHVDSLHRGGG